MIRIKLSKIKDNSSAKGLSCGKRFSLKEDRFVSSDKASTNLISQCQVYTIINRQPCYKRKMQCLLHQPFRGGYYLKTNIKKGGKDVSNDIFLDVFFKAQDIGNFVKQQIRHYNNLFASKERIFEFQGSRGVFLLHKPLDYYRSIKDYHRRASRILRIISVELKPLSTLPYFLRNSSMWREASNIAWRSLTLCFTKYSRLIDLFELCIGSYLHLKNTIYQEQSQGILLTSNKEKAKIKWIR